MIFKIKTKGHKNISSLHKSTFEITKDKEITPSGDCIIGVSSNYVLDDFPNDLKKEIANSNTKIIVILETENASDKIIGWGHENLSLSHSADIVCRKSNYTCSRTLMIKSNKAACDLNRDLINDLIDGKSLLFTIKTSLET